MDNINIERLSGDLTTVGDQFKPIPDIDSGESLALSLPDSRVTIEEQFPGTAMNPEPDKYHTQVTIDKFNIGSFGTEVMGNALAAPAHLGTYDVLILFKKRD